MCSFQKEIYLFLHAILHSYAKLCKLAQNHDKQCHNCINYGINQSRCLDCGYDEEDDIPESEMSDEEIDRLTQEYENDLEAMN